MRPLLPPSLLPIIPAPSPLLLPLVFHSSTSGAQGPRPTRFLARRSSSSAFCFQLWPTLLHFCCVSKYLLAFLFLTTPMFLSTARACVRVCVCVSYPRLYFLTFRMLHTCTVPYYTLKTNFSAFSETLQLNPLFLLLVIPTSWQPQKMEEEVLQFSLHLSLFWSSCTGELGGKIPARKYKWPHWTKPPHTPTTPNVARMHTQAHSLLVPRALWPRAREGFLPVVKTKEAGDRRGTWDHRRIKATGSAGVVSSCGGCCCVRVCVCVWVCVCWGGQLHVFSQQGTNTDTFCAHVSARLC